MITVVVVDDHPIVSQGLAAVLQDHAELRVLGTAADAREALEAARRLHPDVMLIDLELGKDSGLTLLGALRQRAPQVRLLVYTAHDDDTRILAALDAGAGGYVLKGSPLAEIVMAVGRVYRGETHVDGRVAGRVLSHLRGRTKSDALSARQLEVLRLVATGLSNGQIAERTRISERTVKFHLNAVFNKLGAENRAQAVALAAQRGWL